MDTTTITGSLQHAQDAVASSYQALSPACKAFRDTFKAEYEKNMRARLQARCAAAGLKVVDAAGEACAAAA